MEDLSSRVFGRLTVISKVGSRGSTWFCKCICGETRNILRGNLISGRQVSCGCHNREMAKLTRTSHGLSKTPLYRVWSDMMTRCYNPKTDKYQYYGMRGISVSDAWRLDFSVFYNDVKEGYRKGLQLDRVDTNGNYCKENFRWATPKQNSRNRRNNRYFTIDGVTKLGVEWAEQYSIKFPEVWRRLSHGWTEKEATMGRVK